MQHEKEMAVTLIRSDLCNTQGYIGGYLTLPASRGEIQDALDRARIKDDQPYQMVDCYVIQYEELDITQEKFSLEELNFLAYRISKLSECERLAFIGGAMIDKTQNDMRRLINLTYNLVDIRVIPASNDYKLGEFFVDNDFIEAISHVPPEYQDELLELLDYKKIGYKQRISENGIFYNGYYVMNDADTINQVYDGIHLPELPSEQSYVFEVEIANAFDIENDEIEKRTLLLLPVTEKEMFAALKKVDAESLDECLLYHYETPFPTLQQVFPFDVDIDKMNLLAERIRELETAGELSKFKAALEFTDCSYIDQVLDLTQNLDCYDFYPELSSVEDYAKREFINRYQIPESEPILKIFQYYQSDPNDMKAVNITPTPYGIIRRNDHEMKLEHSAGLTGLYMT